MLMESKEHHSDSLQRLTLENCSIGKHLFTLAISTSILLLLTFHKIQPRHGTSGYGITNTND